ncbi:uncharacterized protein PHALS_04482 [Plasmopara halstedii]|uniref:Uncharacterized protein n=1 Tax=Plasmopara halstedii TaxID=4781 RepID=A0A0P1A8L5_PLAHL|nr:uncharacterized protein PHALS_04482 [Plasmopara halstedii]CEG37017.1 hypothetical protein PHALS_04482 [Plasmopara halstedii]|eukprot:XP_024573386.1 hypothetical protein PHALS_04482 [Plasmopara halstedii]
MHLREVQKNSTAPFGSIGWMFHRRYFYGMVACEFEATLLIFFVLGDGQDRLA